MDNMTFFNHLTLAVFEKLYFAFPRPIDIDVLAVAMTVIPNDTPHDETFNSLQASEDAVDFLTREGFLTYKDRHLAGGTFFQARLTLKGLAILGSTPDALEGKQPLIDRIKHVLARGTKEAGVEAAKQLIQQVFAAAVAAAPAVIAGLTR